MARSSTIRVMISSRCTDSFPHDAPDGRPLTEIRKQLKSQIEAIRLAGKPIFEVWINEEAPPKAATWDSWDVCLDAVKDCDVLLALCNGHAGWASETSEVGICHAELMTALSQAPGKVWLVSLGMIRPENTERPDLHRRFQEYVATSSLFRGGEVSTTEELEMRVHEALHEALVMLTKRGVREAGRGRFHAGRALDWTRLDFRARQQAMVEALRDALSDRSGAQPVEDGSVSVPLDGASVVIVPHAVPAPLTVSQAREMVGQPFLRDHERHEVVADDHGGPVHVIACHRSATETQAIRLLGFPDATIVSAPFGVYVADNIQKVQFAFISNCRDDTSTRHGVQRFFEWLRQTGEDRLLAQRAAARARIIRVIAREVTT